jgi:hypothetical protein
MAQLLRYLAVLACLVLVIGFGAFASDEASSSSAGQVEKLGEALNDPAPATNTERARERRHGAVREAIDDTNDFLLRPFTGVADSGNLWVRRGVPTLLALLVYGLGLTLLANYMPRRARPSHDWREA